MKVITHRQQFKNIAARTISIVTILSFLLVNVTMFVTADDGTIFRRNVSGTPEEETEHAAIRMLPLYVPPQTSDGTLLEGVDIINAEGTIVETREYVQPLIVHYVDGYVEAIEDAGGFPGHGERDAFAGVSLDGGATWKKTNLSKSADLSSFKFKDGKQWVYYPGDVGRSFMSSDGNQVMVVWVSRYAGGGSPTYAMTEDQRLAVANYLYEKGAITDVAACTDGDLIATPCPYLEDHFGISGSQGSSDLTDEGYPTVGILPYAALWVSRGVLLPGVDGAPSSFVWFKPERLSSAKRDANRPEVACAKGAGCALTWQEDPEGIRPGDGEGPGEGWSGAVAHHETDIWYSYIDWEDFSLVGGDAGYGSFYNETGDLAEWVAANPTGSPSAAIPMAMPVRVSDDAMCTLDDSEPYCLVDFDGSGTPDYCASTVSVAIETPEGPTTTVDMCVAEDGRLMRGNTASTRARIGLHGYSSLGLFDKTQPDLYPIDSAWFYVLYEENKGLGDEGEDEVVPEDLIEKVDMGKNVWYHTFDMDNPEMVSQGLMMNQPAVYQEDFTNPEGFLTAYGDLGYNFYQIDPDPVYETLAGLETTLLQAEIARRPSNISQDWYDAGESGTVAFQTWKQGIIRRGGPADVMARRFVMPPAGDDQTTILYELLKTTYESATITYETEVIESVCTTETTCVDNALNPIYKYTNKVCKRTPTEPQCYEYIDSAGNLTNDPQTCTETEVCADVPVFGPVDYCDVLTDEHCVVTTTWAPAEFCDINNIETCRSEETWEPVDSCDVADEANCRTTAVTQPGIDPLANPYDYANMECVNADGSSGWAFTDGTNPRYVKGLCAAPALNMSGNTIVTAETCADPISCLDAFPFNDYFDDKNNEGTYISKIFEWVMYGPGYGETSPDNSNLDDPSWENPYDMAKGHRGFMTGDMVMLLYAWTPNWNALTGGHDIVNLYIRRSFDGGATWSTLPASFTHTNDIAYSGDGTTTCEWTDPADVETPVCTTYAAGQFEQARNVSQLLGAQVTVIDPRYAPTMRTINEAWVTSLLPDGFVAPLYLDDTRDPSRYFIVYETGLNSAYDEGEATPLDLFYSRAVDWGDDYLVWQDIADTSACLPSADSEDVYDLSGFCNEFDALEGDRLNESGEAAIMGSPGGMFLQSTWNQIDFTMEGVEVLSDAIWRRVLFLDDYIPPE